MIQIKDTYHFILPLLVCLLLGACNRESEVSGSPEPESVVLQISLLGNKPETRATKQDEYTEEKIESLTLFIFNPEGEREALLVYQREDPRVGGNWDTGEISMHINRDELDAGDFTTLKTIFAVANYPFTSAAPSRIDELLATRLEEIPQNRTAIPMSGSAKHLFMENRSVQIKLQRSIAKFRLTFLIDLAYPANFNVKYRLLNTTATKSKLFASGEPDIPQGTPLHTDWMRMPPVVPEAGPAGIYYSTDSCYIYEQGRTDSISALHFEMSVYSEYFNVGIVNPTTPYLIMRNTIYDVRIKINGGGYMENIQTQTNVLPWHSTRIESDLLPVK